MSGGIERDVEALARIIYEAASDADPPWDLMLASGQATLYLIQARHILASDWYAKRIAKARREALETAAASCTGTEWPNGFDFSARALMAKWLRQRALRGVA